MRPALQDYLLAEAKAHEEAQARFRFVAVESTNGNGIVRAPGIQQIFQDWNASRRVPPMLESKGIKVTYTDRRKQEHRFAGAISCTCKSWLCPECRKKKGMEIRNAIINKGNLFRMPCLYTITINRNYFSGPEDAYDYVMKNKFIARLLTKELGVRRWVWVLEVQEKTGAGFPHWHILVDLADLPGQWYNKDLKISSKIKPDNTKGWKYYPNFFDLNRVHSLLHKWKIGEQCELTLKRDRFSNPVHAIRYITKYLIKTPDGGFPEWMLLRSGIRFFQPSKEIGSLSDNVRNEQKKNEDVKERPRRGISMKTPVERVAECRQKILFQEYDEVTGHYKFLQVAECDLSLLKEFPGVVSITKYAKKTWMPYTQYGFCHGKSFCDFLEVIQSPEYKQIHDSKIANRKAEMLRHWGERSCA